MSIPFANIIVKKALFLLYIIKMFFAGGEYVLTEYTVFRIKSRTLTTEEYTIAVV